MIGNQYDIGQKIHKTASSFRQSWVFAIVRTFYQPTAVRRVCEYVVLTHLNIIDMKMMLLESKNLRTQNLRKWTMIDIGKVQTTANSEPNGVIKFRITYIRPTIVGTVFQISEKHS